MGTPHRVPFSDVRLPTNGTIDATMTRAEVSRKVFFNLDAQDRHSRKPNDGEQLERLESLTAAKSFASFGRALLQSAQVHWPELCENRRSQKMCSPGSSSS